MSDVTSVRDTSHHLGDTPIGHAVQMRERMRALIHAEVDRINPTDDARRALELIIESSLRPSEIDGEMKLTVIDANGQPRMIERNGEKVPFTLQDLLAELRTLHPVLFKSPPKPQSPPDELAEQAHHEVAQPKQELKRDWLTLGSNEPARESQPAPSSDTHALNRWRKGKARFHAWSKRMSERLKASPVLTSSGTMANVRKGLAHSIADSRERAEAFFDNLQDKPVSRRPGFALGAVAAVLLLLGLGAFLLLRPDDITQASTDGPSETGSVAASQVANAPAAAPRSSGGQTLRGVPDVIDTATLSLNGEVVRLFGVEWAPGAGKPEDLTAYLQGREVTCEPVGGNDTYRCHVGGQDLSRVILYNGGGQPTAEATPELKAAANKAREAKIGVWNKQP
ncbi:thermonuclease family protein [Microvirga sp. G4-2]|uniref:thermonuclease family protein n=1 Tax=Microvirga sp. G4-2 TaxID=3434467 RepID=UPI004044AD83